MAQEDIEQIKFLRNAEGSKSSQKLTDEIQEQKDITIEFNKNLTLSEAKKNLKNALQNKSS
jgi:hypothetical protein